MNSEQMNEISDEQLRIQIAEWCGFKWYVKVADVGLVTRREIPVEQRRRFLMDPCSAEGFPGLEPATMSEEVYEPLYRWMDSIPDYANDSKAMADAERLLDDKSMDMRSLWLDYLYCEVGWGEANNAADAKFECQYRAVRATARQRALALVRTIKQEGK